MRYFLGSGGGQTLYHKVKQHIPDLAKLLSPSDWRLPFCTYACDNGAFGAWLKGRSWDDAMDKAFRGMLSKIPGDTLPEWVLLPDVVADWEATVSLGRNYLPILRQHSLPVAVALQDGCDFEEVLDFAPDWVFVAGSTEWKEANIHNVCKFFRPQGIGVHVGRVNTRRRIRLCQSAGVDSCDGTGINKYSHDLPIVSAALKQPCLVML